jgi:hypothetical protein
VKRNNEQPGNIITSELIKRLGPFRFQKQSNIPTASTFKELTKSQQDNSPKSAPPGTEESTKWVEIKYSDGSHYKGQIGRETEKREGQGTFCFADGSRYDGFWHQNKAEGRGRLIMADGSFYEGNFVNGKFEGFGTFTNFNGAKYKGLWKNGRQSGKGSEEWEDGTTFEGEFIEGKKVGRGIFKWADGCVYAGLM